MAAIPWTTLLHQYQTIIFMLVIAEYFLLLTADFDLKYILIA